MLSERAQKVIHVMVITSLLIAGAKLLSGGLELPFKRVLETVGGLYILYRIFHAHYIPDLRNSAKSEVP